VGGFVALLFLVLAILYVDADADVEKYFTSARNGAVRNNEEHHLLQIPKALTELVISDVLSSPPSFYCWLKALAEGTLPHNTSSIYIDGPAREFQRVQPITPSIPIWK
jgi:hypothetical protein